MAITTILVISWISIGLAVFTTPVAVILGVASLLKKAESTRMELRRWAGILLIPIVVFIACEAVWGLLSVMRLG